MARKHPEESSGKTLSHDSPLLPLAELLQDSLDRQLGGNPADIELPSMHEALTLAFREVAERQLPARLEALSPTDFFALYTRLNGDAILQAEMAQLAGLQQQALERELRLAQITQDSRVGGVLHLSRLVGGEAIRFGLFDAERPEHAARRFADDRSQRSLHRIITARMVDPPSGKAVLLNDTWTGPVWAERTDLVPAHSLVRLGSAAMSARGVKLDPSLSLHGTVSYQPEGTDSITTPPQILGYVETLDKTLLLDDE